MYCLVSLALYLHWATSSQCKCHQCYPCPFPSRSLRQVPLQGPHGLDRLVDYTGHKTWLDHWPQRIVVSGLKPSWQLVTSVIPQWSDTVQHLHLEHGARCILHQSVSGTKVGGEGNILEDRAAGQRDLNKVGKWADKDLVKFNEGKCKVCPLFLSIARLEI